MTALVLSSLGFLFAVAIYLAVVSGRRLARPGEFLYGGGQLPSWALMFAGAGVLVGGLGLQDHLLLTAMYGLQASHVALGLALAALCAAMAHKRLRIAARAMRQFSPIEIVSAYYGGVALRVALIAVTLIFALPFAAHALGLAGNLVAASTGGVVGRRQAVFTLAVAMFFVSALGGWRGIVLGVAAQSFLMLALLLFAPLFMVGAFDHLAVFAVGPAALKGALADQIPGVLQFSAGVGKDVAAGGIFTTLTIVAAGGSLIGVVLSPAAGLLATTTRVRNGLAFQQVWLVAGLATGALLVAAPILAAEIAAADPAAFAAGAPSLQALVARLASFDALAAAAFLLMLFASMQIVVGFFVTAAANMIAGDVIHRFLLPELTGEGRRLAARIALAALYAAVALTAAYAPLSAAILGSVALPLSAQLLPAYIGLCWAPWISRQAVVTGFVFGALLVIFTEPPGLVAFEGLFLDLPWGRWPLTIHSTAWGLTFNVAICLLAALFTKSGQERGRRELLHAVFRQVAPRPRAGSTLTTAKWSLTLIWTFLALGPGAILGNTFFSKPMFTEGDVPLGVPSLWVWQIVAWFFGVLLTWWLAYRGQMSIVEDVAVPTVDLGPPADPFGRRAPEWLALLVSRVSSR